MNIDLLIAEIERDEGRRSYAYRDTTGHLTIGVGRNLDDVGLHDDEIDLMLRNDIRAVSDSLDKYLPWWRSLDEVRQRVLANMCFNLGPLRLVRFQKMLAACRAGDYADAANEMRASLWAAQVGQRAARLAAMMESGA